MVTIDVGDRNQPVPLTPRRFAGASASLSSKRRVMLAVAEASVAGSMHPAASAREHAKPAKTRIEMETSRSRMTPLGFATHTHVQSDQKALLQQSGGYH